MMARPRASSPSEVEVRVRLVQNHQERVAVQCTRQCDTLCLASGQRSAALANLRFISIRQADDQFVHARSGRSAYHRVGIHWNSETCDVLRHGAGKQFDVLWEVSDAGAETVGRPLIERGTIETDAAAKRLPHPD